MEVDFPRGVSGGATKSRSNGITRTKGKSVKGPNRTHLNRAPPSLNNKFSVTPETLHTDMLFLGCVNALRLNEVIVELPNDIKGVLAGPSHEPVQFDIGQCLVVAVTGPPVTHLGGPMVPLTIQPSLVNRSLELDNLRPGMYISGIVSSVEDRGYSIDTAIRNTTSFIAKTQSNLALGQPVLCVIAEVSVSSKRLFLIPQQDSEATFKDIKDWKSVSLENVRPGNATKAQVIHKYTNGLGVKIYNQPTSSPLNAFIPSTHLPQPVNSYSVGFRINGKILYVDYRSQSVMVTVLPHLVNHHRPSASLYGDYLHLRGQSFSIAPPPPVERPIASLPTKPPTQALLLSIGSGLESTSETAGTEQATSTKEVEVKVVGVSFLLNTVTASADPVLLKNDNAALDIADLYPGMLVNGSVTMVSKTGIEIQISPAVHSSKCQPNHLTDAPSLQNVQAVFTENEQVQCRVLHIDDETVYLTNKPTLVNSSLHIITSYQHALPGCVAHGWISKVTRSEVFVSFYNNITGVVPSSDIKGAPNNIYHAGEVVVCQVVRCSEPAKGKTENPSLVLTFDIQLANPVPNPLNISALRKAFNSVTIGQVVSGIVSHTDLNGLTLVLESGVTGVLPTEHLSDSHAACTHALSRYYVGTKLIGVLVLNKDSSNMRLVLSKKTSLHSLGSTYGHIKPGVVIPAHVKQISGSSVTVGFLGTSKATVPANEAHSHPLEFELGQSVRVVVRDIGGDDGDENGGGDVNGDGDSTGSPTVDLFDAATKTTGLLLLREYFSGMDSVWSRMKMAKIHVGDVLSGSVVEYRCGRIMIHLENRLLAFVDAYHRPDSDTRSYSKGSTVKGVVIDLDYPNAMVQLSLDQSLVNHISSPSDIPAGKELFGTVLLANPVYLVVCVIPEKNRRVIVYAPGCDYNTQAAEQSILKIGEEVRVVKGDGEENEKRPLFALKNWNQSTTIGARAQAKQKHQQPLSVDVDEDKDKDGDEDDGDDEQQADNPLLVDGDGGASNGDYMVEGRGFEYLDESSDGEADSDIDDLQAYLARASHAKGKRLVDEQHAKGSKQLARQLPKSNKQSVERQLSKRNKPDTLMNKRSRNK